MDRLYAIKRPLEYREALRSFERIRIMNTIAINHNYCCKSFSIIFSLHQEAESFRNHSSLLARRCLWSNHNKKLLTGNIFIHLSVHLTLSHRDYLDHLFQPSFPHCLFCGMTLCLKITPLAANVICL